MPLPHTCSIHVYTFKRHCSNAMFPYIAMLHAYWCIRRNCVYKEWGSVRSPYSLVSHNN